MTIDDKIRDEKLQCNFNQEAVKISGVSSGKIDEYKYLREKEIYTFTSMLNIRMS